MIRKKDRKKILKKSKSTLHNNIANAILDALERSPKFLEIAQQDKDLGHYNLPTVENRVTEIFAYFIVLDKELKSKGITGYEETLKAMKIMIAQNVRLKDIKAHLRDSAGGQSGSSGDRDEGSATITRALLTLPGLGLISGLPIIISQVDAPGGMNLLTSPITYPVVMAVILSALAYKLAVWIRAQPQAVPFSSLVEKTRPHDFPMVTAALRGLDTRSFIADEVGVNEPYKIEIPFIFKQLPGLHRSMIFLGAWGLKRMGPKMAVNIDTVNADKHIRGLLARAVMDQTSEIEYAAGMSLAASKGYLGGYQTNKFAGIHTIEIPEVVLARLSHATGAGRLDEWMNKAAGTLLIHTAKYQVRRYNARVISRTDTLELLARVEERDNAKTNPGVLARVGAIKLTEEACDVKHGRVTLMSYDLMEALLNLMPDMSEIQQEVKTAVTETLKSGSELSMLDLVSCLSSEQMQQVKILAAMSGLQTEAKVSGSPADRNILNRGLMAMMLKLISGEKSPRAAARMEATINTVKVASGLPTGTAALMLEMIESAKANQSEKDLQVLRALKHAVETARGKDFNAIVTLNNEEGKILAEYIMNTKTVKLEADHLGEQRNLKVSAACLGNQRVKFNGVEVMLPLVVEFYSKTHVKISRLVQAVKDNRLPDNVRIRALTQMISVPDKVIATSPQKNRIARALSRISRIKYLPRRAQSYMSWSAVKLSSPVGLLAIIKSIRQTGLIEASIARDLAGIRTEKDMRAYMNGNAALPMQLRWLSSAAGAREYQGAIAKVAACLTNRIKPARLGVVPIKAERNTAQNMLNVLCFSAFFKYMGVKRLEIAEADANDPEWKSPELSALSIMGDLRAVAIPVEMIKARGYKAKVGSLIDMIEKLPPLSINYDVLRKLLRRIPRLSTLGAA